MATRVSTIRPVQSVATEVTRRISFRRSLVAIIGYLSLSLSLSLSRSLALAKPDPLDEGLAKHPRSDSADPLASFRTIRDSRFADANGSRGWSDKNVQTGLSRGWKRGNEATESAAGQSIGAYSAPPCTDTYRDIMPLDGTQSEVIIHLPRPNEDLMKGYRWDGSSGSQERLTAGERLDRTCSFVKRDTTRKD